MIKNNEKKLSSQALTLLFQVYRKTSYSMAFQEQNITKAH